MKCPNCGADFHENTRFCPNCSHEMPDSPVPPTSPPDQVALQSTATLADAQIYSPPPVASIPQRDAVADHPNRDLPQHSPTLTSEPLDTGSAPQNPPQPGYVSQDTKKTAPLENVQTGFAALPEGALIPQTGAPRYQILEIRNQSQKLNVYLVETLQPVRSCPNPECPQGETDDIYCTQCTSQTSEPVCLRYLLKESSEANTFASLAYLHQSGLKHPGLLLFEQFQETPYGTHLRHYLLEPETGPTLASNLTPPQDVSRVLNWGQQLAGALTYLHEHRLVWHTPLTGHHIAVEDKRARWVNFNTGSEQSFSDYQHDVQNLAGLLFYLLTGLQTYSPDHNLPAPVGFLFEQILDHTPSIITAKNMAEALKNTLAEIYRPANIRLISSGQTDVGIVREHNEDNLMVQELTWSNHNISRSLGLYVIADGMGGHSAGEVASGLVISTMAQKAASEVLATQAGAIGSGQALEPAIWLRETIVAANAAVVERRQQARTDMGTTVVAALLMGDIAHIGHVGDSRAYLLNRAGVRQLTIDHSLVERLVATKQITREEAKSHPQRNVIYRTIGDRSSVKVDISTHRLDPGDHLLLCSDGLTGMVSDNDMWQIVMDSSSLSEACRRLINTANAAGGEDNITVIIVQIEEI